MLRKQHQLFRSVLVACDTLIVAVAALLAYWVRFHLLAEVAPPTDARIAYRTHAIPVFVAVPLILATMFWAGLYMPRRDQRFWLEAGAIIKAVAVGAAITFATLSFFRTLFYEGREPSRGQLLAYTALVCALLILWRFSFRTVLRWLRSRGWNLRHVAIIGTGRLGQVVFHTLRRNSWTGIQPSFFVSHHETTVRDACLDHPVMGGLNDLERILDESSVTGVFIALPGRLAAMLPDLLARLERYPVDVRIVPDMNPRHLPINMTVNELDGMPVLSVRESPMSGWGRMTKRSLDLVGAAAALVIFAVPMVIIGLLVRWSGHGPIMFRQERMTLNGQRFKLFKFRTMVHAAAEANHLADASSGTEAWTKAGDPRVTPIGRFLRRTSLDELPQLFNVLLGEMSLVGPRPERPELIGRFREDWRGYMLRQNVKAGITGWAQVNGLRGDTSLRKRLQYDLFYIRNWSLLFDLRILWMTIFRGFAHPNAH